MNNKILRILIMSTIGAVIGSIVGYILARRTKLYLDDDGSDTDVEYINPMDIDIPIDVLMDEETE